MIHIKRNVSLNDIESSSKLSEIAYTNWAEPRLLGVYDYILDLYPLEHVGYDSYGSVVCSIEYADSKPKYIEYIVDYTKNVDEVRLHVTGLDESKQLYTLRNHVVIIPADKEATLKIDNVEVCDRADIRLRQPDNGRFSLSIESRFNDIEIGMYSDEESDCNTKGKLDLALKYNGRGLGYASVTKTLDKNGKVLTGDCIDRIDNLALKDYFIYNILPMGGMPKGLFELVLKELERAYGKRFDSDTRFGRHQVRTAIGGLVIRPEGVKLGATMEAYTKEGEASAKIDNILGFTYIDTCLGVDDNSPDNVIDYFKSDVFKKDYEAICSKSYINKYSLFDRINIL